MALSSRLSPIVISVVACAALAGGLIVSCSNSSTGPAGGPAAGAQDMHCVGADGTLMTQSTSQAGCTFRPPPDAADPDATGAPPPTSDFGATMYNTSGNDDDCKYHVSWTATPIHEDTNVFFMVNATVIDTTTPVIGANVFAEVYLNDTHTAPPTNQVAVENPPGTYKVGPIQFDMPGTWTVRFHLFENCLDYSDESPHGHAAFFIDVP